MDSKTTKTGCARASAAERRRLFVEAYLANGENGTAAAIAAGLSKKSAHAQAHALLKHPEVVALIAERRAAVTKKYELNTELVVRTIVQELQFDPAKLYDEDGQLKPLDQLDEDTRMALTSVEFAQVGSTDAPIFVRKVRWGQRSAAREQAMKFLGMFEKDNKQKGDAVAEFLAGLTQSALPVVKE
jgi:phage terminase small subunit